MANNNQEQLQNFMLDVMPRHHILKPSHFLLNQTMEHINRPGNNNKLLIVEMEINAKLIEHRLLGVS